MANFFPLPSPRGSPGDAAGSARNFAGLVGCALFLRPWRGVGSLGLCRIWGSCFCPFVCCFCPCLGCLSPSFFVSCCWVVSFAPAPSRVVCLSPSPRCCSPFFCGCCPGPCLCCRPVRLPFVRSFRAGVCGCCPGPWWCPFLLWLLLPVFLRVWLLLPGRACCCSSSGPRVCGGAPSPAFPWSCACSPGGSFVCAGGSCGWCSWCCLGVLSWLCLPAWCAPFPAVVWRWFRFLGFPCAGRGFRLCCSCFSSCRGPFPVVVWRACRFRLVVRARRCLFGSGAGVALLAAFFVAALGAFFCLFVCCFCPFVCCFQAFCLLSLLYKIVCYE